MHENLSNASACRAEAISSIIFDQLRSKGKDGNDSHVMNTVMEHIVKKDIKEGKPVFLVPVNIQIREMIRSTDGDQAADEWYEFSYKPDHNEW